MKRNGPPIDVLLPEEALQKGRKLAAEFRVEEQLKELAGRRLGSLIVALLFLMTINGANAYTFGGIAFAFAREADGWIKAALGFYVLLVGLGGLILMFSALLAWLELMACRRADPLMFSSFESIRFYRRSTWLPLIPVAFLPAFFNAWFSLPFFVVVVGLSLILIVAIFLFSGA